MSYKQKITELKNILKDDKLYSKDELKEIVSSLFNKKNVEIEDTIQMKLYIEIRMKELKRNQTKGDLYEISKKEYKMKTI